MPPPPLIGVPVKPFGVAKARLSPRLDAKTRARLGMTLTQRTISIASQLGDSAVITADPAVVLFCTRRGIAVIREPGGLVAAANAVVEAASRTERPWVVLAADLPLLETADLEIALARLAELPIVLAPSHDGGTNLIAGRLVRFHFAYGAGSFHRHLYSQSQLHCGVVSRLGLALDLDTPADLDTIAAHPRGRWLADLIGEMANPQPEQ